MNPSTPRPGPRRTTALVLLAVAFAAALASTSVLTTAQVAQTAATPCPDDASAACALAHDERDRHYSAQGLFSARWEIGAVQAHWTHRPIWMAPVTGDGVRVAVVDTGVDHHHPDLQGRVVAWKDFVHDRPEPYDDTGHGTHVAGIIAAGGHTQLRPDLAYFLTGARGVAPDAQIIAAKTMDAEGRGHPDRIADAILWSLDPTGDGTLGAHVINLSLGITAPPAKTDAAGPGALRATAPGGSVGRVHDAIVTATQAGAVVVVAAGNHNPKEPSGILFPATMPEVITVGATDPTGRVAQFSNQGEPGSGKPDLVAPGVIVSTAPLGGKGDVARYRGLGGTSMAAPFVSGTIALMMEADPGLRGGQAGRDNSANTESVRAILQATAQPIPGAASYAQGAGIVRVDAALQVTGTGEGTLRPAAYATPVLVAASGYFVVKQRKHRRRHRSPWRPLDLEPLDPRAGYEPLVWEDTNGHPVPRGSARRDPRSWTVFRPGRPRDVPYGPDPSGRGGDPVATRARRPRHVTHRPARTTRPRGEASGPHPRPSPAAPRHPPWHARGAALDRSSRGGGAAPRTPRR